MILPPLPLCATPPTFPDRGRSPRRALSATGRRPRLAGRCHCCRGGCHHSSPHKTLPSLTQTALLHIKCNGPNGGCLADRERIDRYLHMVQSSSPSYVLMASIENSIFQMRRMKFDAYGENLLYIRKNLENMRFLQLAGGEAHRKIWDL